MTTAFEAFTLYLAKDLTHNGPADADLKITNNDHVLLEYCVPISFAKRVTDNSNAQNIDKSSPDTGTASNTIELLIRENREEAGSDLLKNLLKMHFEKSDSTVFRKGRFGLSVDDNPELNVLPTAAGGYKWLGFFYQPDKDNPSTQLVRIRLDYVGDHTLLGAFL